MDLQTVKEYFESAKSVCCLEDGQIYQLNDMINGGIYESEGDFWFETKLDNVKIYDKIKGYTAINEYISIFERKVSLYRRMNNFVQEKNGNIPIDWTSGSTKYGILARSPSRQEKYNESKSNYFMFGLCVNTPEDCNELIDKFKDELYIYFE